MRRFLERITYCFPPPGSTRAAFLDGKAAQGVVTSGYAERESARLPLRGWSFRPVHAGALLLLITFLVLPVGMAQAAFLPHRPHLRRTIEQLEEQYRQAVLTGNTATMRRMLSDDYIGIDPDGIIKTKNETLADWKNHVVVLQRMDLSDLHVRVYGATAVVTCLAFVVGRGPSGALNGWYRYTRVYHRLASGPWQIVNFEANRITKHRGPGRVKIARKGRT